MNRKPVSVGPTKSKISGSLSTSEIYSIIEKECKATKIIEIDPRRKSTVVFMPHAWDNFCSSTNYGKWTPENHNESQYILDGYYFVDNSNHPTVVVTHVITPFSVSQGTASAQLYAEGQANAYEFIERKEDEIRKYSDDSRYSNTEGVLNPFYERYGAPVRVGFGHTHPNIGTFFSSVDKTSVFAAPGEPWITMVADPRRCEILCATGAELTKSGVVVFVHSFAHSNDKSHKKAEDCIDINEYAHTEKPSDRPADRAETAECEIIDFVEGFLKLIDKNIGFKGKLSGAFPGTIKFKGKFHYPKKKRRFGREK